MDDHTNRRDFLKLSTAGLMAAATLRGNAASAATEGANDQIVVGLIGCGGRGVHDAGLFKNVPNVSVAYVCDVDAERRDAAARSLGVDSSRAIGDMRKLLDDKALDAVIVATPDHWHSPAAILACDAGKHVYVEKPISHNIRESRLLVDAANRNRVHVQHGTQCRSTPMMIEAVNLLRGGIIGEVRMAKCWNVQRRSPLPRGEMADPPAGLDYDNWLGPAPWVPYRTNRVHDRWTWWYHFGAGDMGNDGVHDIDYTRWGLGVDTHPTKVSAIGGRYYFNDDGEFPDTQQVTFEYHGNGKPEGHRLLIYEQRLWSTNYPHNVDSGAEFYGERGLMFLSRRGKIEVRDERNARVDIAITPNPQNDAAHVANFCAAIRGQAKLNADAEVAHLSTTLCHLGNIATRLGRSLDFDPAKEQIVGDEEANAMVGRKYREHWGTPRT
ncbi:MAG TPA: Gfo/Idh/MocA family oxidoreductase [Lacipirellulaceae bacterium]|jgi:predicted dehydrogenase|nr:Gfo/Idh/MocA family oxidoreductase [Lacipirellulaceae bacterium]